MKYAITMGCYTWSEVREGESGNLNEYVLFRRIERFLMARAKLAGKVASYAHDRDTQEKWGKGPGSRITRDIRHRSRSSIGR